MGRGSSCKEYVSAGGEGFLSSRSDPRITDLFIHPPLLPAATHLVQVPCRSEAAAITGHLRGGSSECEGGRCECEKL
jgi:hypothetical protein